MFRTVAHNPERATLLENLCHGVFTDRFTIKVSRESLSFSAHEFAALQKIVATDHVICVDQN